jgi:acetyl esterase/lipase
VATHYDKGNPEAKDPVEKMSCRPDFVLLGYPVISMDDAITHQGSKKALLRSDPSPQRAKEFSNELQVTEDTPPAFLFLAADDKAVPPENSIRFFEALKKHGVPAEMHIYPSGGHGFSLAINRDKHTARWTQDAAAWLRWIEER